MNILAAAVFIFVYGSTFGHLYVLLKDAGIEHPGSALPMFVVGNSRMLLFVGILVLILMTFFWKRCSTLLPGLLPKMSENVARLKSLEIQTRYSLLRRSGNSPEVCLQSLSQDSGTMAVLLKECTAKIRNGASVSESLAPVAEKSGLEAFGNILIAESGPAPAEALAEYSNLTTNYLKVNMAGELTVLMRWASVISGLVVGSVCYYVFKSVIGAYNLVELLP